MMNRFIIRPKIRRSGGKADTADLKSASSNRVQVQPLPSAKKLDRTPKKWIDGKPTDPFGVWIPYVEFLRAKVKEKEYGHMKAGKKIWEIKGKLKAILDGERPGNK